MADPRNYYAQETLKDGTLVTIRAMPQQSMSPKRIVAR
jgi:hypothetical protein